MPTTTKLTVYLTLLRFEAWFSRRLEYISYFSSVYILGSRTRNNFVVSVVALFIKILIGIPASSLRP